MDSNENKPVSDTTQRLVSLCKEFIEMVAEARRRATEIANQSVAVLRERDSVPTKFEKDLWNLQLESLSFRINGLFGSFHDLDRMISQQIEHSGLQFSDKAELKVRLAMLEAEVNDTHNYIMRLNSLLQRS
jgi:hypothetical protein